MIMKTCLVHKLYSLQDTFLSNQLYVKLKLQYE